jgi:putative membrane protein
MTQSTTDTELITIVVAILAALIIVLFLIMSVGMMGFGGMMGGMWGGGMWGDGTGWMWLIGMLVPFLFLLVLVGAGYAVYRSVSGTDGDSDPALEELRLAYARGELTDEEYEQRRDALERDR